MRHLLTIPVACAALAACAAPGALRPGSSVTLDPGASVEVMPGAILTFDAAEDSRCPPGVRCVWAGKLSYRFSLRRGSNAPETFTLSPEQPETAPSLLGGRGIALDQDTIPAPPAPGTSIAYRATIRILSSNLPATP